MLNIMDSSRLCIQDGTVRYDTVLDAIVLIGLKRMEAGCMLACY